MYQELRQLLDDIWGGDSEVTLAEFREQVQDAFADGSLSSSEYESLIGDIGEV